MGNLQFDYSQKIENRKSLCAASVEAGYTALHSVAA